MLECVVIADDLTGGNATGVLLRKMNYQANTVLNLAAVDEEVLRTSDCVIYPTDSRGISPELAYERVRGACEALAGEGVKVYAHRIDSTLRGNLGSETDAMLDVLGPDYIAIAAPCFPATGRIVCGGYMLVDGVPLHKTNIAIDPKTPVKTSDVVALFTQQSKYGVAAIDLNEMMKGAYYLADRIGVLAEKGVRTIVFDCISQEDLDLIADAVIESGKKTIAVDPGVFTATMARKLITPTDRTPSSLILAVVGSVNPNTRAQMEYLWLSQRTYSVMVETKRFLESAVARESEIKRVVTEILAEAGNYQILTVTGDGIYPENRIDFGPYMEKLGCSMDEVTGIINRSFAEIAYRIFEAKPAFRALYTSGGDVTVAACERFGTAGLRLHDEVLPLAAYGTFLEGAYDGVHIITKGGSQGGEDAIAQCITYLKEQLFI